MDSTSYYFPLDALPDNIREAYEEVENSVNERVVSPVTEQEQNIVELFESELTVLNPEQKIRFLCGLVKQWPYSEYPWAASLLDERDSEAQYMAWLSLRITQTICLYIGASRLRTGRVALREEWESLPTQLRPVVYFNYDKASVAELLQFCFAVLIPFARANVSRRDSRPTREASSVMQESLRNLRPEPVTKKRPTSSTRTINLKKMDSLCASDFTVVELKNLLISLDVLDQATGKWHLGDVTGRAAPQKSAFPAAYRALVEAHLLLPVDSPVYRQLFETAFGVVLGSRIVNYKDGNGSAAFHDYLAESRRWIRNRKIQREAEK
jgi:hypothetical protein